MPDKEKYVSLNQKSTDRVSQAERKAKAAGLKGEEYTEYVKAMSPTNMKDLSGDGKVTKKDVLIGRGVLNKDGSPVPMKGPYKMYGQEVDPRTTAGSGPLAKYGCTKK
jgi:hypothetical protein